MGYDYEARDRAWQRVAREMLAARERGDLRAEAMVLAEALHCEAAIDALENGTGAAEVVEVVARMLRVMLLRQEPSGYKRLEDEGAIVHDGRFPAE